MMAATGDLDLDKTYHWVQHVLRNTKEQCYKMNY